MKPTLLVLLLALPLATYCQTDSLNASVATPKSIRILPVYRPGFALILSVGTVGGGLSIGHSVSRQFSLRTGVSLFNYAGTIKTGKETDNIKINLAYKLNLQTAHLLADFYPVKQSGIRLTGGAFYNLNQVTFFGTPNNDVKFNDISFTTAEVGTLDGKAVFNKIAPYIGLGFGNPYTRNRLKVMFDIGFFYQQSPQITFKTTGLLEPSSDQGAVIENNLKALKYYPIVNLGISYKL